MKIPRSYKLTPNIISRYKSKYLLQITDDNNNDPVWFIYEFNKYNDTHTLDPLNVIKTKDHGHEIIFENNQTLVTKQINSKLVHYYGSITLPFHIQLLIPIEEKFPSYISVTEIEKLYNILKVEPYYKAVYE